MKKVLPLLLLLLIASAGFGQEEGSGNFVPFVSKLKAKADESRILVTWRNPRNLQGTILLYRHSSEIDQDNLDDALLVARLTADQQSYEDTPPQAGPYYYAVLIEDAGGTVQELFVPFRNKTSRGVRVSVLPPVENAAARITGIQSEVVGDSVQVLFQTSNPGRDLLLFRNDSPMADTEDLLEAFAPLQLEAGTTRVIDYPIPGVESYYAVVDTELFKLGKQVLVSGENTTDRGVVVPLEVPRIALLPEAGIGPEAGIEPEAGVEPEEGVEPAPTATSTAKEGSEAEAAAGPEAASGVEAPGQPPGEKPAVRIAAPAPESPVRPSTQPGRQVGKRAVAQALAETPLPYLQPTQDAGNIYSIPQERAELDPQTREAVARILASTPPLEVPQREVVILPEDRDEPAAGESTSLYRILQEHLLTGDYITAEEKLQGFLNIRRSAYTEARVRFYLAQSYYFQGLYEEALLEFVLSQGQLYAPVQPWLESCFRRLRE